jgi:FeS assembly SUF system regulator
MSKLTDYGIVIMSYLAKYPEIPQSATEIAANLDIPQPTVSKILKTLVREGLLRSQRGLKGGYYLMMQADAISIADLIDALEGPIALTECGYEAGMCQQETGCSIRENWLKINKVIHSALDGISLAQMNKPISPKAFHLINDKNKLQL